MLEAKRQRYFCGPRSCDRTTQALCSSQYEHKLTRLILLFRGSRQQRQHRRQREITPTREKAGFNTIIGRSRLKRAS